MIKLINSKFRCDRLHLDEQALRLYLVDERYKDGIIGYLHHTYDLSQLVAVKLCYEYPDLISRQELAQAKTKSNRISNAALGAFGGAVIDSLFGDDDSMLDGVLIGGAVGAAVTPVQQINFKENTDHYVVMLFKSGDSLAAEVDIIGYTKILQALYKALVVHKDDVASNPVMKAPLTEDQIMEAEEVSKKKVIKEKQIISIFMSTVSKLILLIVLLIGSIDVVLSWLDQMSSEFLRNEASNRDLIIFTETNILVGTSIFVFLMSVVWYLSSRGKRIALEAIKNGAGKPIKVTENY